MGTIWKRGRGGGNRQWGTFFCAWNRNWFFSGLWRETEGKEACKWCCISWTLQLPWGRKAALLTLLWHRGGVLKLAHSSSRERTVHFAQFPSQGSHVGSFKLANAIKQGFPPSPQSWLFQHWPTHHWVRGLACYCFPGEETRATETTPQKSLRRVEGEWIAAIRWRDQEEGSGTLRKPRIQNLDVKPFLIFFAIFEIRWRSETRFWELNHVWHWRKLSAQMLTAPANLATKWLLSYSRGKC